MKAIAITEFGGRNKLKLMDLPEPEPKSGEALIRIKAAGVNPVDWMLREGYLKDAMPYRFPLVIGLDAAGVIEKIGEGVTSLSVGDEVYAYCRTDVFHRGAYAEYISLPCNNIAKKPSNMSFEEAASVPCACLTAFQSLFDAAKLQVGESILIHGGAGGVGGFAVQLAADKKALVIATAREPNHNYVLNLGAQMVIDYTIDDFSEDLQSKFPHGLDVALDTVGVEVARKSLKVLGAGARLVSTTTPPTDDLKEYCRQKGITYQFVFVSANADQLNCITSLIEQGKIKSRLSAVLPFKEAAKAHEMMQRGHACGKIVLSV